MEEGIVGVIRVVVVDRREIVRKTGEGWNSFRPVSGQAIQFSTVLFTGNADADVPAYNKISIGRTRQSS